MDGDCFLLNAAAMSRMQHAKLASIATIAFVLAGAPLPSRAMHAASAEASPPRPIVLATRESDTELAASSKRRFALAIAENLPRVADPEVVITAAAQLDAAAFRDAVVRVVREVASGKGATCALSASTRAPIVWLYRDGEMIGRGEAQSVASGLCLGLKDATRRAIASSGASSIGGARFLVELPDRGQFILEHEGRGLELTHGMVPVRSVDRAKIAAQISDSARYLSRVLDPDRGGAHKYYDPRADRFQDVLHTVYSASTALTFLKLYAHDRDPSHLARAKSATRFVLSMQNATGTEKTRGAFFYSFDTSTGQHDDLLPVGTASKSIFTLLELHALTKDPQILDAARKAADWLLTMQRVDGSVSSSLRVSGASATPSRKESLLYTGQVLSALSRMYRATHDKSYLAAAARTATYLGDKVAKNGCHLGDDYRAPNPISSSWVVMSLLDFDRATNDGRFERTVFHCADALIEQQDRRSDDPYRNGRYRGALSSSGTGWIAEVMSEVYQHCGRKGLPGCDRYKDSVVASARIILQHAYTPANSFMVKNPQAAVGGVFWSSRDRWVRTDAVCHATNAFLGVIDRLGDGPLVEIAENALPDGTASTMDGDDEHDDGDE